MASLDNILRHFPHRCIIAVSSCLSIIHMHSDATHAPQNPNLQFGSVYVGMPRIAQHGVDESSIEVTNLEFLDPTPESVVMTQAAILHSPSIYTPTLDPFNASLYLVTNGTFASEPMTVLGMPKIHALHPQSNASVVGQKVPILNLDQLTDYATQVLVQENVTTALVGKTKLHEGHLPVITVNYNSSSTYKGASSSSANHLILKSADSRTRTQCPTRLQRHRRKGQPYRESR